MSLIIGGDTNLEEFAKFFELVELHPDLKSHIVIIGKIGACIQHPLIYSMMHHDSLNKMINARYESVKEALNEALATGQYERAIFLHERPYRLNAFVKYSPMISSKKNYWEILGRVWSDTDNSWQSNEAWEFLWSYNEPERIYCMDEEEREIYNALPEKIVAYRGTEKNKHGMSWTRSIDVARRFSKMHYKNGFVYQATIAKKNVVAYFNGRYEDELVVIPRTFRIKKLDNVLFE